MCITVPLSKVAILPTLDPDDEMIVPLVDPNIFFAKQQKIRNSYHEVIREDTTGTPNLALTDLPQQSVLWPKPQEFVIGSYELLLLCTEHFIKTPTDQVSTKVCCKLKGFRTKSYWRIYASV
jgi:hypothetical protein